MKIIKKLSDEEVRELIPSELLKALNTPNKDDVMYCMICDGLRLKDHKCMSCIKSRQ